MPPHVSPPPNQRPPHQQSYPPLPTPRQPRRTPLWFVLAFVAALGIVGGVVAVAMSGGSGSLATTVAEPQITVPNVVGMTGNAASEALTAAGFRNINFPQNISGPGISLTQTVVVQYPTAGGQRLAGEPVSLTLEPPGSTTAPPPVPAYVPPAVPAGPLITFGNGTYEVGTDIAPGKYRSPGVEDSFAPLCYWDQTDAEGTIVDQGVANEGPSRAALRDGLTFKSQGCENWVKAE